MATTALPPCASATLAQSAAAAKDDPPGGLTSDEAFCNPNEAGFAYVDL